MLAAARGQLAEAEPLFEAAVALEESVGSLPQASRTRVAHARSLLRSGHSAHVRRATPMLDDAATAATRLGMTALLHEIDSLQGAQPRSQCYQHADPSD